jgi:hypothetical protein
MAARFALSVPDGERSVSAQVTNQPLLKVDFDPRQPASVDVGVYNLDPDTRKQVAC